jgi:hypothetical protein
VIDPIGDAEGDLNEIQSQTSALFNELQMSARNLQQRHEGSGLGSLLLDPFETVAFPSPPYAPGPPELLQTADLASVPDKQSLPGDPVAPPAALHAESINDNDTSTGKPAKATGNGPLASFPPARELLQHAPLVPMDSSFAVAVAAATAATTSAPLGIPAHLQVPESVQNPAKGAIFAAPAALPVAPQLPSGFPVANPLNAIQQHESFAAMQQHDLFAAIQQQEPSTDIQLQGHSTLNPQHESGSQAPIGSSDFLTALLSSPSISAPGNAGAPGSAVAGDGAGPTLSALDQDTALEDEDMGLGRLASLQVPDIDMEGLYDLTFD